MTPLGIDPEELLRMAPEMVPGMEMPPIGGPDPMGDLGLGMDFAPEELEEEPSGPDPQEMKKFLEDLSLFLKDIHDQYDKSLLRKQVLQDIEDSRRSYAQKTDETNFPWPGASNMVTPLTRIAVDENEPRLVASIVGRQPYLKVAHRPGATSKEEANAVEDYINYVLEEEVRLYPLASKLVHKMLLDGTVFPLVRWERKTVPIKRRDERGQSTVTEEPVFDGPQVTLISAEHVWLPDDVDDEDWEDVPVFRFVREFTEKELLSRAEQEEGWILENLKATSTEPLRTTEQILKDATSEEEEPAELRKVSTLEAFLPFEGENLVVLVDRETFKVLRLRQQFEVFGANRKPIRRVCLFREEGVSWGEPIYNVIRGLQDGTDAMWNRCVNSADITMTPWGFVKRGISGGTRSRLRIYPGRLFEVDDPAAYNFPNLGMFKPTEFVPLLSMYKMFYEKSINIADYNQGMESSISGKKGSTATGTLAILQEGKVKHEYRGSLLQYTFLDLLLCIYDFTVDNMPQTDVMPVTGQQVLRMSLTKDYTFGLGPSTVTANRFVDRKETEDFMMVMTPYMSMLNPMTILGDILRSYGKRPDEYIDPELNQIVQQYLVRKENIKALAAMGIPEDVATQLADQGVTPKNVGEFVKQLGEQHGQMAIQGSSGSASGSNEGAPVEQGGQPAFPRPDILQRVAGLVGGSGGSPA
jgi:hypothetical protein